MKKFISSKLMCLALIACAVPLSFAERYDKQNEVTSIEELEFPLRRISYSEFRDDFDRVVADGIREEVKNCTKNRKRQKSLLLLMRLYLQSQHITNLTSYARKATKLPLFIKEIGILDQRKSCSMTD